MSKKSIAQVSAWQQLSRLHRMASQEINAALKARGLPGSDIHDLLAALAEAADAGGVTAKVIQGQMQVPQYAVSRLLDRAEAAQLIGRAPHPGDNRSQLITLTKTGQSTLAKMTKVRNRAISSVFKGRLRPGQVKRLDQLLRKMETPPKG